MWVRLILIRSRGRSRRRAFGGVILDDTGGTGTVPLQVTGEPYEDLGS